jgi:peptidoglycan biosynthesis protein MviN/MurJ (putative lipid II flippase)
MISTRTGRDSTGTPLSQTAAVQTGQQPQIFARRSASFIGLLLLAGRLLERAGALGQVLLIAVVLGSTTGADLYFIASIVPLALGNVVGEALAATSLPRAARETEPGATKIFAAGFWTAAVVLGALTAVYLTVVAVLVPKTIPAGTASLLPWIAFAPVAMFFGLGTYCAAPLLHYERYIWPALRSATATFAGLGLTAIAVSLGGGVVWIGLSVSTGYGVALLLLVAEIVSIGRISLFALPTRWALREVFLLWPKVAASVSSGVIGGQVFVLIERLLTAPLGVGAVASISYARGVAFTPSVLGQAIGAGLYPSLLRAHAADAADYVRGKFISGLRLTLFVTVVSGAYLALYSQEIADALFGRDAVTPSSLVAVQQCLVAFSLALVGWMLTIYSARLFGALNLFRGLLLQELVALVVYVAIVFPLRGALGIPGVALAYGIGQVLGGLAGASLIARRLHVGLGASVAEAVLPAVGRAALVVFALGVVLVGLRELAGVPAVVVLVVGALIAGGASAVILWPADWAELDSLRGFISRRLRRGRP